MKFLFLCLGVAATSVGCGDDSPAGGSSAGGSSAGGEAAGGEAAGGAPGTGGTAEGGAAPQGLCVDTAAVGSCPVLTGCPDVGEALCGCSAVQEGEECQVEFNGQGEGCGFPAMCTGGEWVDATPP